MTLDALLADLRARGIMLVTLDGRLQVDAPKGTLTPALCATLAARKAELLEALQEGDGAAPVLPPSLRSDAAGFAEAVVQLLTLPLDRFAECGQPLELRVAWWPEPLWFVPTKADAERLVAEGVTRGRVWTAGELLDFLAIPGLTKAQAQSVAQAKLAFDGTVTEIRAVARADSASGEQASMAWQAPPTAGAAPRRERRPRRPGGAPR